MLSPNLLEPETAGTFSIHSYYINRLYKQYETRRKKNTRLWKKSSLRKIDKQFEFVASIYVNADSLNDTMQ